MGGKIPPTVKSRDGGKRDHKGHIQHRRSNTSIKKTKNGLRVEKKGGGLGAGDTNKKFFPLRAAPKRIELAKHEEEKRSKNTQTQERSGIGHR